MSLQTDTPRKTKRSTMVYPQLKDLDFTTQAAKLNEPVTIFAGSKELIWLDGNHSAGGYPTCAVNWLLKSAYPFGDLLVAI